MRFTLPNQISLLAFALIGLGTIAADGMDFKVLHSFDSPPDGPWPGLVQAGDGNFYGVTDSGGSVGNGVVYRYGTDGTITVVHNFAGNDGTGSEGRLALGTNGWLYGTTYFGGPANAGTVFKVSTNGDLVTLASFAGANGVNPQTGLTLGADGYFYGTTYYGGAFGQGALYKVSHAGDLQLVFSFSGSNGVNPGWNADLCLANDGNLYGTTREGGPSGNGVIFKVNASGTVSTLVDLADPSSGFHPLTGLVQGQDGLLYGSTTYGGAYGGGSVFKVDLNGNVTTLGSFDGTNGYAAESSMIQASDGNFYATSSSQVLRITPGGSITTIYQFPDDSDTDLEGKLVQGSDGHLYGTSYDSGFQDRGFLYKAALDGSGETESDFVNLGGSGPTSQFVWGGDGNIYGTCALDGVYGVGTVFRVTPGGIYTNIYHFDNTNGNTPAVLIGGNNGNLYGTAYYGGAGGNGTVFQVTTNGVCTLIGSLDSTNGSFPTSLLQAGDGTFYGTTWFGGPTGTGTIFKMDTSGALSTLYGAVLATGNYPANLLQGLDGNLYGTALNGPALKWKLSLSNSYNISLFAGSTLAQDAAGLFYTTIFGGSQPLYCVAGDGSYTNIGNIPDYDPNGLLLGVDGNFYGSSQMGGTGGQGSIWVMNRNGRFARLVSFDGTNGASPQTCPILGGDGQFYGSTVNGGSGGGGVIYVINLASPEIIAQPLPQGALQNGTATLDVIVFSTNAVSYQWQRNGQNIPGATNVACSITNAQPGDFAQYSVAVTSGGTTVVSSNAALTMLPDRPLLTVQQQLTNIVLSWPSVYVGFGVEQSTNLSANLWQPVTQTISSNAGVFSMTIPVSAGSGAGFYRLQK